MTINFLALPLLLMVVVIFILFAGDYTGRLVVVMNEAVLRISPMDLS